MRQVSTGWGSFTLTTLLTGRREGLCSHTCLQGVSGSVSNSRYSLTHLTVQC